MKNTRGVSVWPAAGVRYRAGMAIKRRTLTDDDVVRLLDECGDRLRDHAGETSEGESVLRATEGFVRQINERFVVYVQFRDLRSQDALDSLKRIVRDHPTERISRRDDDDTR